MSEDGRRGLIGKEYQGEFTELRPENTEEYKSSGFGVGAKSVRNTTSGIPNFAQTNTNSQTAVTQPNSTQNTNGTVGVAAIGDPHSGETTQETTFILPMTCKYTITSQYGYRIHPTEGTKKFHSGIDIVGTHHTEILAVADGEITYAGVQSGYGNCIEIKHIVNGETIYSFYAHLSQINVKVGEKVTGGTIIGLEGGAKDDPNHGTSTGHHLHFELRTASGSGHSVDPNKYLEF